MGRNVRKVYYWLPASQYKPFAMSLDSLSDDQEEDTSGLEPFLLVSEIPMQPRDHVQTQRLLQLWQVLVAFLLRRRGLQLTVARRKVGYKAGGDNEAGVKLPSVMSPRRHRWGAAFSCCTGLSFSRQSCGAQSEGHCCNRGIMCLTTSQMHLTGGWGWKSAR